jgi:hypothetical protein
MIGYDEPLASGAIAIRGEFLRGKTHFGAVFANSTVLVHRSR